MSIGLSITVGRPDRKPPPPLFEILAENGDLLLSESNNEFLITENQLT
jgi:hypothetical protein